jgi:hypothetical protein
MVPHDPQWNLSASDNVAANMRALPSVSEAQYRRTVTVLWLMQELFYAFDRRYVVRAMSTIRRLHASKYGHDDPRRYITGKDCLSEPEVLKTYCDKNPNAVCLGGYAFLGCCPEGKKREDFVKYDLELRRYIRSDGTAVNPNETYCGRKIPHHPWKKREYSENRIWAMARLGIPDLIDGDMIIEAKGGLPSSQKIHTALGQLLFYKEVGRTLRLGFLFPRVWSEAENLQHLFPVLQKYGINLLQV